MTKTVLVTGCSSGVGRSTALAFAGEGWNVIATMRRPQELPSDAFPEGVLVQPLDVTDPASAGNAFEAGARHFGGIDVVVNNAGVSIVSVFEATPVEAIQRVFNTNVLGPMNVTRAAIPYLRERGGIIVNVSSGVGLVAVPLLSLYVASKHALEGFSESVAYELESQGIGVKLVEPGAIRSTRFSENTIAATNGATIPESYRAYFDHAMAAMIDYPFADTPEQDVVDTILRAAADPSTKLRYPVGPDIETYAQLRWSSSEATYGVEMAKLVGQARWREATGGGALSSRAL